MREHFLEEDLPKAYKEKSCLFDLSIESQNAIVNNDFYKAEQNLIDMMKSVNELRRMSDKKKNHNRMNDLLEHLNNRGISAELVRRIVVK